MNQVFIYCIEDINDLKYVGSTKKKLNKRLCDHRWDKNRNWYCSSKKLNLYNCIIYELETCNELDRKAREKYWINHIDCVNQYKYNFDREEHRKNNKQKKKEYDNQNYEKRIIKKCINDIINQIELNK